jgi:hypothetical protein
MTTRTITHDAPDDDDRRQEIERMAREMNEQLAPPIQGPIIRPRSKPRIVRGDAS